MARPKTVKSPKKLNLYIPAETKRALYAMATKEGRSLSWIVSELIRKEVGQQLKEAA